jgi:hypothetical protein
MVVYSHDGRPDECGQHAQRKVMPWVGMLWLVQSYLGILWLMPS